MIEQKKKLRLEELEVDSFVTSFSISAPATPNIKAGGSHERSLFYAYGGCGGTCDQGKQNGSGLPNLPPTDPSGVQSCAGCPIGDTDIRICPPDATIHGYNC